MQVPKTKLRSLRKNKSLSQKEVAAILGMSRKNYCYIESGQAKLTVENAQKLKTLFEVQSIEDLLEENLVLV